MGEGGEDCRDRVLDSDSDDQLFKDLSGLLLGYHSAKPFMANSGSIKKCLDVLHDARPEIYVRVVDHAYSRRGFMSFLGVLDNLFEDEACGSDEACDADEAAYLALVKGHKDALRSEREAAQLEEAAFSGGKRKASARL